MTTHAKRSHKSSDETVNQGLPHVYMCDKDKMSNETKPGLPMCIHMPKDHIIMLVTDPVA